MTDAAIPPAAPAPLERLLAGRPLILRALVVMAGVAMMGLASQIAVPLGPVPLTLQTYGLFLIAGVAGMRLSFEVVLVWLLCAIIGLPVLAGGAAGPEALIGPTAGFLAGMLAAATLAGRWAERPHPWWSLGAAFLLGHVLILALGWGWLATRMGAGPAFLQGVLPFAPGAILKSIAAALTVKLVTRKAA